MDTVLSHVFREGPLDRDDESPVTLVPRTLVTTKGTSCNQDDEREVDNL